MRIAGAANDLGVVSHHVREQTSGGDAAAEVEEAALSGSAVAAPLGSCGGVRGDVRMRLCTRRSAQASAADVVRGERRLTTKSTSLV